MMKNKNYFFLESIYLVFFFSLHSSEATMPGRGKTTCPWWTHFQQIEGCVEIIMLFLIWIVQVTFDLQNACNVTRWCEEGKLAAVLGKRPIQAWLHTWGLSMVVLLSRWCSLLKCYIRVMGRLLPQLLMGTWGCPWRKTGASGEKLDQTLFLRENALMANFNLGWQWSSNLLYIFHKTWVTMEKYILL